MRSVIAALLVVVATGVAHAQIDNSALECGSGATFYPRGDHWPVVPPLSTNPVPFRQQQDGAPTISGSEDIAAVTAAAGLWNAVDCGGSSANVELYEDALYSTRDRGDVWVCPDDSPCDGSNCDASTCSLSSVQNIIYFVTTNWDVIADTQTVALTTNLFIPDTGFIVTADLEFNAQNYQWRAGGAGCTAGSATCYDVGSVGLHELGHFLGFNHVMCADAVMFPHGSGTDVHTALSVHEREGLCTVYPPRGTPSTERAAGEQCYTDSQCPSGHSCIKPTGHDDTSYWGWCARDCVSDSGCPTGFICGTTDVDNARFCKPGPNGTGGAVTGTVDPTTGVAVDLCQPCTEGSQCSSGVCVSAGGSSGICTQACMGGTLPDSGGATAGDCPLNMDCVPTDQDVSVCYADPSTCGTPDARGQLNEICYQEVNAFSGGEWFNSCGPDLICFGFLPRCATTGREGACVQYCNATDMPCQDRNMECCFGVDANGNCLGPSATLQHGGCFDIRRAGESCVVAEQSICEQGSGCFNFGDASLSKCYDRCDLDGACVEGSDECVSFTDGCSNQFALCCAGDDWGDYNACVPSADPTLYDVGVACRRNEECDSRLCLSFEGEAACSRYCNPVTGVGCPGDIDVNGDGVEDGGFRCRLISGEGRCWPINGPATPPVIDDDGIDPPGGCCSATSAKPGDWLLSVLLFVPMLCLRRRR